MSDYAVVLYFDGETQRRIQTLVDKVALETGVGYMKTAQVPPHVTVAMVRGADEEAITRACEVCAVELAAAARADGGASVCFASIGVFNPSVLFLAPVMNEFLRAANARANDCLKSVSAP